MYLILRYFYVKQDKVIIVIYLAISQLLKINDCDKTYTGVKSDLLSASL